MIAVLAAVLFAIAAVVGLFGLVALRRDPLREIASDDLAILTKRGRRRLGGDPKQQLGRPIGAIIENLIGERGQTLVRTLIQRAGLSEKKSPRDFFDEVGYYTLIMGSLGIMVLLFGQALWLAVAIACFGLAAPFYVLWASAAERQETIDRDLPDFLDVLAVVVSAGVGFQAALRRVSERYGGPIGEEMQLALQSMTVGEGFRTAMTEVRERTGSDSVDQFVTALLQAEELGSPLADALNQIAVDVRREASEAEKRRAARASPRATIITIVILIPPTMAIMVYGTMVAIRG